jgi:peptidyl-prolyl cis-trans isomerase D
MLRQLRNKKTAKKVWIFLAIVVIPPFIFWGSGSLMRNKQEETYAGKLFGKKISLLEFKDAADAARNQMVMQFGDKFEEMQKYLNLESLAWDRLILLMEAKKRKIKTSDNEVVELLQSYPFFQKKGRFDNVIYAQMLQYVFHTQARIFEEQTRQNLILSKLYSQVTYGVGVTDAEVKEEYRKANEQVSIHYIASLSSDFEKDITASEQEIKDYFAKNSLKFKQPLSFNIEYVSMSLEGSDKQAIEDKINGVLRRLNKKEPFNEVAKNAGLELKDTGLFNQTDAIPGIGWSPEILNQISKATAGSFLNPILIDKTYYIIKLKEKKEPYIPGLETVKDKAKDAFIKEKAMELAKEKIENCLKKLKEVYQVDPKSADFEKSAEEYGIKSNSTDLFKYGSYIEGIGVSDNFWTTAQNLKEDEFSGIIDMPSGFYIIKLKSKVEIDAKKFESEQEESRQKLESTKKTEFFGKFTEELKRKAQAF